jgi:hypothetical protein
MHEPSGYPGPNDVAISAAASSDGVWCPSAGSTAGVAGRGGAALPGRGRGRHQAAPARGAVRDGRAGRARDRGRRARAARADPDPRRSRHPALGQNTVKLSAEFPDARFILAHAAISDLAWLWHVLADHPNIFIDTAVVEPGRPHRALLAGGAVADRLGVGLALRPAGARRLVPRAGRADRGRERGGLALDHGRPDRAAGHRAGSPLGPAPPPALRGRAPPASWIASVTHLCSAIGRAFGGGDPDEPLALARPPAPSARTAPHADTCAAVLELLDLYREHLAPPPPGRPFPVSGRFIIAALFRRPNPAVPLPAGLHTPTPTREEADA